MAKGAQSLSSRGRPAMAGLLLWAVCASMTGCLFPQDDQVFPELPPKRNAPVKILSVNPPGPSLQFFNGTSCLNESFTLRVDDEDISDTMRSRWFLGEQSFEGRLVTTTGSRGRDVPAPTDSAFRAQLSNLVAGKTELLTVFVADTEVRVVDGKVVIEPRMRVLPDGTSVLDDGYSDSFTWVLNVEACQ